MLFTSLDLAHKGHLQKIRLCSKAQRWMDKLSSLSVFTACLIQVIYLPGWPVLKQIGLLRF